MKPTLDHSILLDLASETGRCFAVLPPDFAQKMAHRLRRKFKVTVAKDEITALVNGYVEIYHFGASVLKDCMLPRTDIYAHLQDIDQPKFMGQLTAQFPAEDIRILDELAGWVIYYEYLR